MKPLNISNDIIPLGEFKSSLSKKLKSVQTTGHPLIITQNGRPAGVLLSPSEYDDPIHKKLFIESINRGINDADSGNVFTTDELQEELLKKRSKRHHK
jgi:antitoxin YefM